MARQRMALSDDDFLQKHYFSWESSSRPDVALSYSNHRTVGGATTSLT